MTCPEPLRLQAYFDGELDALAAAEFERHAEGCASCGAALAELTAARSIVRDAFTFTTPAAVRARIEAQIAAIAASPPPASAADGGHRARSAREPPAGVRWWSRTFWVGAFGGAGTVAAAAIVGAALLMPPADELLVDGLLSGHVGSLLPGHLIAVESSDRHTVKPWFAGHADVSPTVADFAADGYPLVGGRADYVARQRAAVLVYRHGAHLINVYCWRGGPGAPPTDTTRDGYRLVFWQAGDLRYAAVTDTGWDELRRLRDLLVGAEASRR